MKEIILPPLRSHVPGVAALNPKPNWHLPIHVHTKDGIDLDFGPLLLFDRAVIDASSLEYIRTCGRKDLVPLAKSLAELDGAGYVNVRDFGTELERVRSSITHHVERLLNDPLPLREPVLRGIEGYRTTIPLLRKAGTDESLLSIGFGMHLLMMRKYGYVDPVEKQRLDRLMRTEKQRWKQSEIEDVRALVGPTITYLYQNVALGELLELPFLDVDYTSELYAILRSESLLAFDTNAESQARQIREGQNLFNCIIPELRPASAKTMLSFLRSDAVHDFRAYVSKAAQEGRSITESDYKSLLLTTLNAERKFRQVMGGIAWGERILSLIPGAGLVVSGISLLVEKALSRKTVKRNEWVYALIEAARIKDGTVGAPAAPLPTGESHE